MTTTMMSSSAPGLSSGTMMPPHDGAGSTRPPFVHDILSGDEDAVLSFQLAVRLSLSLSGEKVRGLPTGKDRAKVSDQVPTPPHAFAPPQRQGSAQRLTLAAQVPSLLVYPDSA